MEKAKRTAPLWITILCLLCAVSSLGFTVLVYAQNNTVYLPWIEELTFEQSQLQFSGSDCKFTYDTEGLRYTEVVVTVTNEDAPSIHKGTIRVSLFIADQRVALGQADETDVSVSTSKPIHITLLDDQAYDITKLTKAVIQLQQTG